MLIRSLDTLTGVQLRFTCSHRSFELVSLVEIDYMRNLFLKQMMIKILLPLSFFLCNEKFSTNKFKIMGNRGIQMLMWVMMFLAFVAVAAVGLFVYYNSPQKLIPPIG